MIRRGQAWRRDLDPRDPDYDGPDEDEDIEEDPDEGISDIEHSFDDSDPRLDGPYHYIPPGDK